MATKFCAQCGTELTKGIESGRERQMCPQCGFIVYRNPAPVAVVLATRDDKLLLVLRRNAPLANYWAPPAGYIEIDETLEEGAARETKEETGLDIQIDRLIGIYSRANMGVMFAVFAARVVGGEIKAAEDEVIELGFFGRTEIPRQSAPVNGTVLEQWFYEVIGQVVDGFEGGWKLQ